MKRPIKKETLKSGHKARVLETWQGYRLEIKEPNSKKYKLEEFCPTAEHLTEKWDEIQDYYNQAGGK